MPQLSQQTTHLLLKISAILWVIWGIVHAIAGILTIILSFYAYFRCKHANSPEK